MSNPYNVHSVLGHVYGYLQLKGGTPLPITAISEALDIGYKSIYNALSRDKVGGVVFETKDGVRCAALSNPGQAFNSDDVILKVMQSADSQTVGQIAYKAYAPEEMVKSFINNQNKLGNISITPAKSPKDYKYEWVGQVKEPDIPIVAIDNKKEPEKNEYIQGFGCLIKPGVVETALVKTDQLTVFYKPETPKPEGATSMGKEKTKQSAYMVVVDGETSLHISKEKADELAAQQAKSEASVFIYEIVSVSQVVYKPTIVAHDLANLCS